MSKEGYLVYHEDGRRSQICYSVLGEGKLQLYSRRENGLLVKEMVLSKSKLKIRGIPDKDARECPFSFTVNVHRSKIVDGRQVVFGKPTTLVLSAPSWAERKSWGNAIHAWQRNYWGEPQHKLANMTESEIDAFFNEQYRGLEITLQTAGAMEAPTTPPPAATATGTSTRSITSRFGTPSRIILNRAKSLKSMGSTVRKKVIRSASVTFSLPPMGLSITSSLQQQQQPPGAY